MTDAPENTVRLCRDRVEPSLQNKRDAIRKIAPCPTETLLQSPRFIDRIETQRGDGSMQPVTGHELASRLSNILWGGPSDRELLQPADAGELSERPRIATQVQRMLRDLRGVDRGERFIHAWLYLDQRKSLRPDPKRFPNWNEQLASDMKAETLAIFRDVAWERNRPSGNCSMRRSRSPLPAWLPTTLLTTVPTASTRQLTPFASDATMLDKASGEVVQ